MAQSCGIESRAIRYVRRRGGAVRLGDMTRQLRRPDTRANVELSVVFGVLSLRAFDLMQGTFAVATGSLAASANPRLELTVFMLLVVESGLLGAWRSAGPCGRARGRSWLTSAWL
jgi:hypothetical protein